ncbi:hypothetical protein J437_LFUL008795, partial [Ladona fulva]
MSFDAVITAVRYLWCAIMILSGKETDCSSTLIQPTTIMTYPIMLRSEWEAKPPKSPPIPIQEVPVPYVILHDTRTYGYCNSAKECMEAMRKMQMNHQDDLGWNDIDCSFFIGNLGLTMEGLGWDSSGTDAPGYNERSIGICIMGDYSSIVPDDSMLNAAKNLIKFGIAIGKISANYTLLGHRQVRNTDCPGNALFNKIQQWPHWRSLEDKKKPFQQMFPDDKLEQTEEKLLDERAVIDSTTAPSFPIMPRSEWGAKPPKSPAKQMLEMPVPFVILHDMIIPRECNSTYQCKITMKDIQENHQDDHNYNDIEYSFCIGNDGLTMEARGWDVITEN